MKKFFMACMLVACSPSDKKVDGVGGVGDRSTSERPVPTLSASQCVRYSTPMIGEFPRHVADPSEAVAVAFVMENACDYPIQGDVVVRIYDEFDRIAGLARSSFKKMLPGVSYDAALPVRVISYYHQKSVVRADVMALDMRSF